MEESEFNFQFGKTSKLRISKCQNFSILKAPCFIERPSLLNDVLVNHLRLLAFIKTQQIIIKASDGSHKPCQSGDIKHVEHMGLL